MCIAAWIWQAHPLYPFLLLLNRDEYHERPTEPMAWWREGLHLQEKMILGGRDALAGGTWLGCTREGKVAFVTNVLETDHVSCARSRGDLPTRFLQSSKSPQEYAEEVVKEANKYNGFNLILADIPSKVMVYVSNRPKGEPAFVQVVSPGIHVLANAKLDTPWPKAKSLRTGLRDLFLKHGEKEVQQRDMVQKLMRNTIKADKKNLPNTGYDSEWEFQLSSIFVEFETKRGRFGTRSTAALSVKTNGKASFYETYLDNGEWKDHMTKYRIEYMQ